MNENSNVKVNVVDVKDLFKPNNDQQQQSKPEEDVETDVETPFSSPERDSFILSTTHPTTPTNTTTNTTTTDATATSTTTANANANRKEETQDDVGKDVTVVTPETIMSQVSSDSKEDYTDWPFEDIKEPHPNDVLYGRGGGTNHHAGNKRYRKLVEGRKVDYVNSKRLDKPLVALEIIKEWRSQVPPGRFLKMNNDSGLWQDVGDKKAREKTSQALREKAPLLRKQQEEQRREARPDTSKNTRFNVPEKLSKVSKNLSRGMLARDHSLGRDYLSAGEKVSVKGFSWTAPALEIPEDDNMHLSSRQLHVRPVSTSSSGSWEHTNGNGHIATQTQTQPPQPPSNNIDDLFSYAIRGSGSGSVSGSRSRSGSSHSRHLSPNHANVLSPSSHSRDSVSGSVPPPSAYAEKWTAPPIAPVQQPTHNPHTSPSQQSNETAMMDEWRTSRYHDPSLGKNRYPSDTTDHDYLHPTRSADDAYQTSKTNYYNQGGGGGGGVPPPNSHLQSNDYGRFASILGSNTDPNHPHASHAHAHPHPHAHNPNDYMQNWRQSSDVMYDSSSSYHSPDRIPPAYGRHGNEWRSPTASHSHSQAQPPQSPMHYYSPFPPTSPPNNQHMVPEPTHVHTPARGHGHGHGHNIPIDTRESSNISLSIPRPPTVKRDTSHKLQTSDIEPTTKRINRQSSIGHRNLSSMSSVEEITEKDIKRLNTSLEQSSLAGVGRDTTSFRKPVMLNAPNKFFDIGALDLDLDVNNIEQVDKDHDTHTHTHTTQPPVVVVNKPQSLTSSDRLTTFDHFIVDMEETSSSLDANGQKIQRQTSQTSLDFSEVGEGEGESNANGDKVDIIDGVIMKPSPISDNDRFSTLGTLDSDFIGKITNSTSV